MSGPRTGARQLLDLVLDPGSWVSRDAAPVDLGPSPASYAKDLSAAQYRSGMSESIITGEGTPRGRRAAVAACEFAFLAGSVGVAAAERLVLTVERATRERLPLVVSPTSGGTRMQEGTIAFLQMVKMFIAVAQHRAAGLPYLVYLCSPTTGGVLASWGSLGHVTVAEPGALIGFLGPRVYEAMHGEPFAPGVQLAENLYDHGLIDAVVPPEDLRENAADALEVLSSPRAGLPDVPDVEPDPVADVPCPRWPSHPTGMTSWRTRSAARTSPPASAPSRARKARTAGVADAIASAGNKEW